MIAPVFLSASEPNPTRSKEYYDSRKLLNLREAVLAFCAHALPHFPVVFGGHPAITPLVRSVAERIAFDMSLKGPAREPATLPRPMTLMFQSGLFVERQSSREEAVTEPLDRQGGLTGKRGKGWRNESLLLMRYEMLGKPLDSRFRTLLSEHDHWLLRYGEKFGAERKHRLKTYEFSAAVFIGGMEGVEREFHIFRSFHPTIPMFPIGTTGSACIKLLDQIKPDLAPEFVDELYSETAYSLLMQRILPSPSPERPSIAAAVGWRVREAPRFQLAQHADPVDLDKRFINFKPQS